MLSVFGLLAINRLSKSEDWYSIVMENISYFIAILLQGTLLQGTSRSRPMFLVQMK